MSLAKNKIVIPRHALRWLALALLCLVPTMVGTLSPWVTLLFLGSLLSKFWMEQKGIRLRSGPAKFLIAIAGFGAVYLTYGSATGIEPGVSILVLLASLKILESHTALDFHILVMVGWILCLCGFFVSQNFRIALCVFAAFMLLVTALVQYHRGPTVSGRAWPLLSTAFLLLLQAVPLVVAMFFLFPRGSGAFQLRALGMLGTSDGFVDHLAPGSVAAIAHSPENAFRVEFPDGKIPAPASMYWRGAVLYRDDGLNWQVGAEPARTRITARPNEDPIRQRITLEPNGTHSLFALDWPVTVPPGASMVKGDYLRSSLRLSKARRYDVTSVKPGGTADLSAPDLKATLQLPSAITPAVRTLVASWKAPGDDPRATVRTALQYFRKGGFSYSLSPGAYGRNGFDEFLFQRKTGFCEHYAATFATLMRLAGIPARVIVGYQGGQWNEFGKYLLVRQSDAHAWCEVWLPGSGWERVDPTAVVAPERVSLGLASFLDMRDASGQRRPSEQQQNSAGAGAGRQLLNDVQLVWDSVNYAWDTRVLSFDVEQQQAVLSDLTFPDASPRNLLLFLAALAVGALAFYTAWIGWSGRPRADRVKAAYDRFCSKLAKLGAPREPAEGPSDFARRATALVPTANEQIARISSHYIHLRYAAKPQPGQLQELVREVQAFPRVSSARGNGPR